MHVHVKIGLNCELQRFVHTCINLLTKFTYNHVNPWRKQIVGN